MTIPNIEDLEFTDVVKYSVRMVAYSTESYTNPYTNSSYCLRRMEIDLSYAKKVYYSLLEVRNGYRLHKRDTECPTLEEGYEKLITYVLTP